MKAEILPALASDDLLPGGFVEVKRLEGYRIKYYDLVYVSALKDLDALGVNRVAGEGDGLRVSPLEQIAGDILRLEHSCHHMSEYVSVIDQEHISDLLFADVSVWCKETQSTVLAEGGEKSYVVLRKSASEHEAGLHIM